MSQFNYFLSKHKYNNFFQRKNFFFIYFYIFVKIVFMSKTARLTIEEQINRALDGRSQGWVVDKLVQKGIVISEVQFSRKKKGRAAFENKELKALSEILDTKISK